jgi:opacity protein-like surface antigen
MVPRSDYPITSNTDSARLNDAPPPSRRRLSQALLGHASALSRSNRPPERYHSLVRTSVPLLAAIAAFHTATAARAQEWPRYHVGVGIHTGEVDFETDWEGAGVPEFIRPTSWRESESGSPWRLSAGFRPLRVVGAEIEYIDLGDAKAEDGYSTNASVGLGDHWLKTKASAIVLTAVLFIPERSPSFDVYGKVGVAAYKESFDVHVSNWTPMCRLQPFGQAPECLFDTEGHETNSQPYVGLGARFKVAPAWAVRIEYEAIDDDFADATTMLFLGIAWER